MALKNETTPSADDAAKRHPLGLNAVMELFDVGRGVAITVLTGSAVILLGAILYFIHSAPPSTLTISSGPKGSIFHKNALKYAKFLEENGVKATVLTSKGSFENLQRVADQESPVDVGIVQAGLTVQTEVELVSLGSISYQPLFLFYHGPMLNLVSGLAGKKIAIGAVGSGTRTFASSVLAANGIKEGGNTKLLAWDAEEASQALLEKKIDAAFVMSESASSEILHRLLHSDHVHLFNFKQAHAYNRKIDYLNVLELPEGIIDFGLNIPAQNVTLVGPMVELVAAKGLHPAFSDLLLEAATSVHGRPGVFQRRGEFPSPIEHAIRISDDATRFYKSGKSFLYRYLPFWLASLVSRVVVVFLPTLLVLVPLVRSVPAFFRWLTQNKIHRRYRELLLLEREYLDEKDAAKLALLRNNFDRIENAVNKMKVRAALADQFYGLRGHIDFVRQVVARK